MFNFHKEESIKGVEVQHTLQKQFSLEQLWFRSAVKAEERTLHLCNRKKDKDDMTKMQLEFGAFLS